MTAPPEKSSVPHVSPPPALPSFECYHLNSSVCAPSHKQRYLPRWFPEWDIARVVLGPLLFVSLCLLAAYIISVTVAVPLLIQRDLNGFNVTVVSLTLANPKNASVDVHLRMEVDRPSALITQLDAFEGYIVYQPSDAALERTAGAKLSVSAVPTSEAFQDCVTGLTAALSRYISSRRSADLPLPPESNETAASERLHPSSAQLSCVLGIMKFGAVTFPQHKRRHRLNATAPLRIVQSVLFQLFLHEMAATGKSVCRVIGYPAAASQGTPWITARLHHSITLQGLGLRSAQPLGTAGSSRTARRPRAFMSIEFVDMTRSTPQQAHLDARVLLRNPTSAFAIDSVGRLQFLVRFNAKPLAVLTTATPVSLKQGNQTLMLQGEMDTVGDTQRKAAVEQLILLASWGEPVFVELEGIASSIHLFSAVVRALRFSLPLPVQRPTTPAVPASLSVLQGLHFHRTELEEYSNASMKGLDHALVAIRSRATAVIANPFGPATSLTLRKTQISGRLVVLMEPQDTPERFMSLPGNDPLVPNSNSGTYETPPDGVLNDHRRHPNPPAYWPGQRTIGQCVGTIVGLSQTRAVRSSNGAPPEIFPLFGVFPSILQTVYVEIALVLDFSKVQESFRQFLSFYLSNHVLTLRLVDANVALHVDTPLGTLGTKRGVPVAAEWTLAALQHPVGIQLLPRIITALKRPVSPASGVLYPDGGSQRLVHLTMGARIPQTDHLNVYIQNLAVELRFKNDHFAYLIADHCHLSPDHPTVVNFTGLAARDTAMRLDLHSLVKSNRFVDEEPLQVIFLSLSDLQQRLPTLSDPSFAIEQRPQWLHRALDGLTMYLHSVP